MMNKKNSNYTSCTYIYLLNVEIRKSNTYNHENCKIIIPKLF